MSSLIYWQLKIECEFVQRGNAVKFKQMIIHLELSRFYRFSGSIVKK
jgi:hypothetical protein